MIELDDADSAQRAIARLQATGRYEYVESDRLLRVAATPNDPGFYLLWALDNTGASSTITGVATGVAGADIKAVAAWDIIHDAPNVVVAVLDSGVNINHQDIAANIWRNPAPTFGDVNGASFINGVRTANPLDDGGHGTHVAGIIGSVGNNGIGNTGVAWKVQIMPVKIGTASGYIATSDFAAGIDYAIAHGAHIMNASFFTDTRSQTDLVALAVAREAGIILVVAAGNDALSVDVKSYYPGSYPLDNIVTVGSSNNRDGISSFSNFGAAVDLFAPGEGIISLYSGANNTYAVLSGTSMAAPHVTGALALIKARFPNDNYRQLINRLLRGADALPAFADKAQTGGRLNLLRAITGTDNRPFNDDFARRAHVAGTTLSIRANNTGGTTESGEPAHAGVAPSATLWWEWTAPATATVTLDTLGSAYDTVLAVYTGTSLPTLVPVAANDNNGTNLTSRLTFSAQAGATYAVAVGSHDGTTGLTLLHLAAVPANDAFAAAITLTGESTHVTATNILASREPDEPHILGQGGGASVWYRWTAPRNGRFQIAVTSRNFDPLLAVYTGSALNALSLIAASDNSGRDNANIDSICTLDAIAGTTYFLTVDSKVAGTSGDYTLNLVDSLWQASTVANISGAPAVADNGTIYVGGTDFNFYAFAPDGSLKWTYPLADRINDSAPSIGSDGTVYFGSNENKYYALHPDGTLRWMHDFGPNLPFSKPVVGSPALAADGTIYVKAGDGYLYALAPADGATRWRYNVNALHSYASPSLAPDGTIYQGSDDQNLYALNPNGTLRWTFATGGMIYATPALDNAGNLYFGVAGTGACWSITPGGTLRWVYTGATGDCTASPALSADGGTVYFGSKDGKLHAVNSANGIARWTFALGDAVDASSPAVDANGVIYLGCYDFKLYAVYPNGTLKRTYDTGGFIRSSPVVFGTTLYVGSDDGKLYAFEIGVGSAGGPWPQYHFNARRTGRAVADALAIAVAPQAQDAVIGQPLTLSVTVTGAVGSYQWQKNGVAIAGATSASYTVGSVTASDAGDYTVVVSAPGGTATVTSTAATVTVLTSVPGRLTALSVRATAGTGDQTLIVGFYFGGTGSKRVLIRGIGPTLAQYGVSGVLADPQLKLFNVAGTQIDQNDDWGGSAAFANAFASAGTFALPANSKDAALLETLPLDGYTAQVNGANNSTGVALVEVYEADTGTPTARFVSLSARDQVGTGDNVLIAGFTFNGNVPKKLLIRGVGPSLAQYGVSGVLANPRLDLYQGTTLIQSNDDWGGSTTLSNAFNAVSAFQLTSPLDAVLLVTLPPGSYTAQVSGVNGTTGVALIEVYEMP